MRWQPCDRDLNFRGTWHWLPRDEEEDLLGPTTFEEAFEQLLECHKRYDARCWSMESPELEELGDHASVVTTVTTQRGSSATHFFIGDDETSSIHSLHTTLDCETFYIGEEVAASAGTMSDYELAFESSLCSQEPMEGSHDVAVALSSSSLDEVNATEHEAEDLHGHKEPPVISLAERLGRPQPKAPKDLSEWRPKRQPTQQSAKVTLQLNTLIPRSAEIRKEPKDLFQQLGRESYIQKRIHRKLHDKVSHLGDQDLFRLGELCFQEQLREMENNAAGNSSPKVRSVETRQGNLLSLLHQLTASLTSQKTASMLLQ